MVSKQKKFPKKFPEDIKPLDFLKYCRVCLVPDLEMNKIFETKLNRDMAHIGDTIMFCTGIELLPNDGLPTQICKSCIEQLTNAYRFKTRFLQSDKLLRNALVKCKIKEEPDVLNNVDDSNDIGYANDDNSDYGDEMNAIVNNLKKRNWDIKVNKLKKVSHDFDIKIEVKNCTVKKELKTNLGDIDNQEKKPDLPKVKHKRGLWCKTCKTESKTVAEAIEHTTMHEQNFTYVCEICGKVFRHRSSQISHQRTHYPPSFACDKCPYRSSHKHDLAKHVRIHGDVKPYQCSYCPASFHVVSNVRSHERRTHQKKRDHICPVCGNGFFDATHLKRHIDAHNDIKRHSCDLCGAAYSRRCYWKRHMERHHGVSVKKTTPGRQKTSYIIGANAADETHT